MTTSFEKRDIVRAESSHPKVPPIGGRHPARGTDGSHRKGSFIIPIHLPISEFDVVQAETEDLTFVGMEVSTAPEPVQRRVMRMFAESLGAIDAVAVRPEREPHRTGYMT